MKDSILKGAGNSRFLKSAVPAGTSWADALAMLQAGTFPIDFNGINAEGFQQVGTPLNKANLLKDATAAQIGLPSSTTPDGMFQALGNTGELHVWRKTVTTSQEIPAGYNLVPVAMASTILMYLGTGSVTSSTPVLYYATEINISNDGNAAVESNGKLAGRYYNGTATISNYVPPTSSNYTSITDNAGLQNLLRGKFVTLFDNPNSFQLPAYVSRDKIYQIPADATISFYHGYSLEGNNSVIVTVSKLNEVVGYPLTPAGTTATYPVSTNPNAYQEGSNAGTTIEYLGKLGDKARVQVVSYVGTGTYGSSNPNSLTFDFVPKLVIIRANGAAHVFIYTLLFLAGTLTKTFQENGYVNLIGDSEPGLSDAYARVSGRTLSWYSVDSYNRQANYRGAKYTAIAIG